MPVVSAAVTIAFFLLAILCLDVLGLPGLLVWVLVFAVFYKLAIALKRHVSPAE